MSFEQDSVWKEVLEACFEEFLRFFFPRVHHAVDWSREIEFLDKELEPLIRDGQSGKNHADKLVKVTLRSGEEVCILVHVEVQGYWEADFPERMHRYNHRIQERFGKNVVSLAVLTDDRPAWRPVLHGLVRWGFAHIFLFPIAKLTDYRDRWGELETSENPFAVVVMTHLKYQEAGQAPERRLEVKLGLIRTLYKRRFERKLVEHLLRFIDWILTLPEELDKVVWREVAELEGVRTMPYVTSWERLGERRGLRESIVLALLEKFGEPARTLVPRLEAIVNADQLRAIFLACLKAESLDELSKLL